MHCAYDAESDETKKSIEEMVKDRSNILCSLEAIYSSPEEKAKWDRGLQSWGVTREPEPGVIVHPVQDLLVHSWQQKISENKGWSGRWAEDQEDDFYNETQLKYSALDTLAEVAYDGGEGLSLYDLASPIAPPIVENIKSDTEIDLLAEALGEVEVCDEELGSDQMESISEPEDVEYHEKPLENKSMKCHGDFGDATFRPPASCFKVEFRGEC